MNVVSALGAFEPRSSQNPPDGGLKTCVNMLVNVNCQNPEPRALSKPRGRCQNPTAGRSGTEREPQTRHETPWGAISAAFSPTLYHRIASRSAPHAAVQSA